MPEVEEKDFFFLLILFYLVFLENNNFVHAAYFEGIFFPSIAIDILAGEVFLP